MRRITLCILTLGILCNTATAGEKSPKTAFFLSLLVPGLGELYSGAKWRAAGFMATETLTWTAYFSWRGKGNDLKADFRIFADQHWNPSRYEAWRVYNSGQPKPYYETEHLPTKTDDIQQYYELIGKYDQFVFGWSDVAVPFTSNVPSVNSPLRENYETQRNESNKYLKRASVITGLAVLNRIVSAIHASAYVRTHQQSSIESPVWIDITPIDGYGRTQVEFKARF